MIDSTHPLILGSASPRRRDILHRLGIPLLVHPVEVDESSGEAESAGAYLRRIVAAKLEALAAVEGLSGAALLVADTAVVVEGEILGKPQDDDDAARMLRRLSGRTHRVSTRFAVAVAAEPGRCAAAQTVHTQVRFRRLDEVHVARYVATGEGRDKAGAYAVQGLGAFAVEHIEGSFSNVVGLPACEVVAALEAVGVLSGFPLPGAATPSSVW